MSTPQPSSTAMDWTQRYPDRWHRELDALRADGWETVIESNCASPSLTITATLSADGTVSRAAAERPNDASASTSPTADRAEGGNGQDPNTRRVRLQVRFPAEYPFFPPLVTDADNDLRIERHRTPAMGVLCLLDHDAAWNIDTTLAELLSVQLPRLLRSARRGPEDRPPDGLETPAPEPVGILLPYSTAAQTILLPTDTPIPAALDEGAVVLRFCVRSGDLLGAGVVDRILGEGLDITGPLFGKSAGFRIVTYGRWARDPDFDPADTAAATYERLQRRLQPLTVHSGQPASRTPNEPTLGTDTVETLLLLVPSETDYRTRGEDWAALLCFPVGDRHACTYVPVQRLGPSAGQARVPEATLLTQRQVVIVGVGALGGVLAEDLARTGVGSLHLVDGDRVDVATAPRQYAPPFAAGGLKTSVVGRRILTDHPYTTVHVSAVNVGSRYLTSDEAAVWARLDRALRTADLVIDTAANPAATRYLSALRQAVGKDFLHASATAGAWGGFVQLATPETGCWSCLQHHRAAGPARIPVPPADPNGIIHPAGCSDPSYTGRSPDLAVIAHHASRVAIERLMGHPGLGGDLHVAYLRDVTGRPLPPIWRTVPVLVHPDCPLHGVTPEKPPAIRGASNAHAAAPGTVPEQPREGEADGHSPLGAPIQRTQQRNNINARDVAGGPGTQSEHQGGERQRSRLPAPAPGRHAPTGKDEAHVAAKAREGQVAARARGGTA